MKVYLIWAITPPENTDTTDRDYIVNDHTAKYGPFYLAPCSYSRVQDFTCEVLDLSGIKIVESPEDESEKTEAEFLALHDQLAAQDPTGKCVVLSLQQGKLLHKERYNSGDQVV